MRETSVRGDESRRRVWASDIERESVMVFQVVKALKTEQK